MKTIDILKVAVPEAIEKITNAQGQGFGISMSLHDKPNVCVLRNFQTQEVLVTIRLEAPQGYVLEWPAQQQQGLLEAR